ncbi:MAG: hypothetical protein U1F16_02555 [Turneriella sp.]
MVRWIILGSVAVSFFHTASLFSADSNPPVKVWYVGLSAGYSQPYFFGLINDIHVTAPASFSPGVLAGREAHLAGSHFYGFEIFTSRSLATEASRQNFVPTFSAQYPAGATIRYTNIAQRLGIIALTYRYVLNDWLSLVGKLGAGVRHLHAAITLEAPGASYNAASPSGAMAILSVALGFEFTSVNWGHLGIFYRSVPPVVYSVPVGTATVRSADAVALEWRMFFR